MSDIQIPPSNDVKALEKIEKKIINEGKAEDHNVSHALKDLAKLEKSSKKAAKALSKSTSALEKTHRKELSASKALNKASHKHDVAVANIANAEKDVEVKKAEAARLEAEVAKRKEETSKVIEGQREHNSRRETKLAEIHHARAGTANSHGTTGTAAPTTDASANAPATNNVTGGETVASPTSAGSAGATAGGVSAEERAVKGEARPVVNA